jgi:Zn finger protein HypA/HybF involved in hydrogenase expression
LATACALFLINLTGPPDLVTPHDPTLGLSIHSLNWILGSLTLAVALDCLFGNSPFRSQLCVAWLATNAMVYQISLVWLGAHGLSGYLEGVNYTFRTSPYIAEFIIQAVWIYLLVGSSTSIWCLLKNRSALKNVLPIQTIPQEAQTASIASRTLKIACTACGGHIEFPTNRFGEKIPCPHCQCDIILQKASKIDRG